MGQFLDLHTNLLSLLDAIGIAVTGLRTFTDPPTKLPEMPCIFLLTPDETFILIDNMTGESTVTTMLRLCVAQTQPQALLLELSDTICEVTDPWLIDNPLDPVSYGRRTGMRGVTPVFNEIPCRGADFPIEVHLTGRPVQP